MLPELLKHPDRSLIPELFIRYIVEIDSIIDRKDGKEYLINDLPFVKRKCSSILKELLLQIWGDRGAFDRLNRKKLSYKIWKFRQESLIASRNAQSRQKLSFYDLLYYKEKTAGELFHVWVDLLCDLYQVNYRAENSKKIIGLVAMAIQVVDDMIDSPADFHNDVNNIFNHILKEIPDEFNIARLYFERNSFGYLDCNWANKYLPNTCKMAIDLIGVYIKEISKISENQNMTSELCEVLKDWKVLHPELQSESSARNP